MFDFVAPWTLSLVLCSRLETENVSFSLRLQCDVRRARCVARENGTMFSNLQSATVQGKTRRWFSCVSKLRGAKQLWGRSARLCHAPHVAHRAHVTRFCPSPPRYLQLRVWRDASLAQTPYCLSVCSVEEPGEKHKPKARDPPPGCDTIVPALLNRHDISYGNKGCR